MNNLCMAHRGWSGAAPENTLAAMRKTLELPGVEMIELDVQLTRDQIPVVIHDYTLSRTTNGSGRVSDYTLAELKRLDAGSWFAPEFAGEMIPTLEEVFQLLHGRNRLNIELKRAAHHQADLIAPVLDLIRRFEMEQDVIVTSFHHPTIQELSTLAPELKTGLIFYGMPVSLDEQLTLTGARVLSLAYPYLTQDFAQDYLNRGFEVVAWTIDDPQQMREIALLDERVAICTNHPDRWLALQNEVTAP